MDVTVFELHLPGAKFNAPFAGRGEAGETEAPPAPDAGSGGSLIGPVGASLVIIGLAALAWYLRRTGPADGDRL